MTAPNGDRLRAPLSRADFREQISIHESSHARVAMYYGIPVDAVGFAEAGGGATEYPLGLPTDPLTLVMRAAVAAAGPVGQEIYGFRYDPSAEGDGGDFKNIDLYREGFARHTDQAFPDPHHWAAKALGNPSVWADVILLARGIIAKGGMLRGNEIGQAIAAGVWQQTELIDRIRRHGPRGVTV